VAPACLEIKEAALFSGDVPSAFVLRVLLLLDVLLPFKTSFAEDFMAAGWIVVVDLTTFFLLLLS
jgi:hypothetical protein